MRRTSAVLLCLLMTASLLCGCASGGANDMELGESLAVPFADGEAYAFTFKDDEVVSGTRVYKSERVAGGWHLYSVFTNEDGTLTTGAVVQDGSLRPISSYKRSDVAEKDGNWSVEATYGDGKLRVQANSSYGAESTESNLPDTVHFDSESIVMVMRAFPLAEGFSASFRLAFMQAGEFSPMRAEVTGIEEIDGRACYRVSLGASMAYAKSSIVVWYTTDALHEPMRIEQGTSVFERTEQA